MFPPWLFETQFQLFSRGITIAGLLGFALCVGIGLALSTIIQSEKVRHVLSRTGLDKNFVALITGVSALALLLSSIVIGIGVLGLPINWSAPIPGIELSLSRLLRLVILFVAVFWISSVTKRFLFNRYLSRIGANRALQYSIAQVTGYVVLLIGIFVVMQNAGLDLSTLTVFAGAVGVGIGFGLQNIASNFISGLVILTERPIKIGDRVEVEKVAGIGTEIRARSTTVLTNDNIAIIVPNSRFIDQPVTNWTHVDRKVRFRLPVPVAYGSDVGKVREALLAVAREHPASLTIPEPAVFLDAFGESAIEFELIVWSSQMSARPRRYRSDLNYGIEQKLREAGVQIPVPRRDVRLIRNDDDPRLEDGSGGDA